MPQNKPAKSNIYYYALRSSARHDTLEGTGGHARSDIHRDHVVINGVTLPLNEILNEELLTPKKVETLAQSFKTADPFPHLVFEGLFSPLLLELVHADFEGLNWLDWRRYNNPNEKKLGSLKSTRFGNATQLYFNTIHSGRFVNFLEQITTIAGLIPDPTLLNGGMHQIPTSGKFSLHIDFNQHPVSCLDNRLVFITYLNKDWLPSYGGALELWNVKEDNCKRVVEPTFGQSILFYQSSRSLHGHPNPVNAPNGRPRRSVAAYYYTNGRTDEENSKYRTTIFPSLLPSSRLDRIINVTKYMMPPILLDAAGKLKGRFAMRPPETR